MIPFALLTDQPETEVVIGWLDEDEDEDEQTLVFDGDEYTDTGTVANGGGFSNYHVRLEGLDPDTVYSAEIEDEEIEFKTPPDDFPINACITSDIHPARSGSRGGMGDPTKMQRFNEQDADVLLIAGDFENSTRWEDVPDRWLDWWDDYYGNACLDYLRPIFATPGNHEVDWNDDPDDPGDPQQGYFADTMPTIYEADGPGNCAAFTLGGDKIQFVSIDTFSTSPSDAGEWLEEAINEDAVVVMPIHHQPILPVAHRNDYDSWDDRDPAWQSAIRDHVAPVIAEADNIYAHHSGHIHVRGWTHQWTVVDDEPDGDNLEDYFELQDGDAGYLIAGSDVDGPREFGHGWMSKRGNYGGVTIAENDLHGDWYVDWATIDGEEQLHLMEIQNLSIYQQDVDGDGETLDEHYLAGPVPIATLGDVTLGDVTFGGA